MFEIRLRIVFILFVACWSIIMLRLFQLQVVQADYYQQHAENLLTRSTKYLQPIRGRILDRNGRVLASDEPSWSIALHYRLLSDDPDYLKVVAEKILKKSKITKPDQAHVQQKVAWLKERVSDLWQTLSDISEDPPAQLRKRAERICRRVARWKADYEKHHGLKEDIAAENECHPIVLGLNSRQQIDARAILRNRFPWLTRVGAVNVTDSSTRHYHNGECMAHILGTMGKVTRENVHSKPFRQGGVVVNWEGYQQTDLIGTSGVEVLSETLLRGKRGRVIKYLDDRKPDRIEPVHGEDLQLTIDYNLQSQIYEMLRSQIESSNLTPGGSIVVLDVPTRDVLALVSCPAYDPNRFRQDYPELSREIKHFPLHFRAVYSQYAPGSIVKPITVIAAHSEKVIDEHTTYNCEGYLVLGNTDSKRCWTPAGRQSPIHHGLVNSEEAIKHSCNIFCYKLGNKLGVAKLTDWLGMFGVGQTTGIGLQEEKRGVLPTPSYLAEKKNRPVWTGDARNYAIGQGEILVTPLQAANIVATYASGEYQLVRLTAPQEQAASWQLPVKDSVWQLIRRGMYRVVNESGGTATHYAKLIHEDYVLCGKSGSAQTPPWRTAFDIDYQDGNQPTTFTVSAHSKRSARREFHRLNPQHKEKAIKITAVETWPPDLTDDDKFSHAWFVAFIQKKGADGQPDWRIQPRIAIAVLLEFGGSGGRMSGPLCRDVAELIIHDFPQYVESPTPQSMVMQ